MLRQLIEEMHDIDISLASIKKDKVELQEKIDEYIADKVEQARLLQGKDLGTVTVLVDDIEVKHTIGKKVTWDQGRLFEIFQKIIAAGDRPASYMKMTFSVPEKTYGKFEGPMRDMFKSARTLSPGSSKVEFKTRGEA